MTAIEARELDYGITMAINTLVTAMGMVAENQHHFSCGNGITYGEESFNMLTEKNGTGHNGVLSRWEGILG